MRKVLLETTKWSVKNIVILTYLIVTEMARERLSLMVPFLQIVGHYEIQISSNQMERDTVFHPTQNIVWSNVEII